MTIKSIKLSILTIAGALSLSIPMLSFSPLVSAAEDSGDSDTISAPNVDACAQLPENSLAYDAAGCNDNATEDQLPNTIINILNAIIGFSSLIAVVFIIIGGISYMTSSGDAGKVKKAKDTILYACVGLVVCVLAFAIANFAINMVNSSNSNTSSSNPSNNNPSITDEDNEE